MTDSAESSPVNHTHSSSRKRSTTSHKQSGYMEPVIYFSGAILLLILAKILHLGMIAPAAGILGIIILTVSKIWKFKPGIVFSSIFTSLMLMFYIWLWVDIYIVIVFSGELATGSKVFFSTITEGIMLAIILWVYHRLLNSVYLRMGQKWFVKKPYVVIFKLLFYFQLFLIFFWVIALLMQKAAPVTSLGIADSSVIAAALALLAAGIPAIIYLIKTSSDDNKVHRHRHHHRHHRSSEVKNDDIP
jgi:hypothetical protein